jgi:uncharacterized protein YlbG (UPF0298 family)
VTASKEKQTKPTQKIRKQGHLNHLNNSIQFFIIYVPSQLPKGQLQTHHSLDTGKYIIDKHKLQVSTGGRK